MVEKKQVEATPPHESEPVPKKEEAPKLDGQAFAKFLAKNSAQASSGALPSMRRRKVYVTIYPEMCRPNTFDGPIEIGLEELDSASERKAYLSVASSSPRIAEGAPEDIESRDPTMVGAAFSMALARLALVELNGYRLQPHEAEMVWEALGLSGRQVCGQVFLEGACGMDQDVMAKSRASVRVG